jgi:hypothetical protein
MNLCTDADLGYASQRTRFSSGQALLLDQPYRLAHLPLVAPSHPKVIASKAGTPYLMGLHDTVTSLVLPVPPTLYDAPAFRELVRELKAASFAPKIAWDILEARRSRLHATLCSNLARDERFTALAQLGKLRIELRGLFSGSLNHGRLYLKTYPERIGSENALVRIQRALKARVTDLYPVGLFNLLDDLTVAETADLARLIDRWWDMPILRFEVDRLWLLSARDDLVLDAEIVETIPLNTDRCGAPTPS